jgi:N-glycosylase/DNA lyase
MKKLPPDRTNELDEMEHHYMACRDAILSRLSEFRSVPPSEYFYELVFCLLTPQSSAAHAEQAVQKLREAGFQFKKVDPAPILGNKNHYIRFHNMKSRYIVETKAQFPAIARKLSESISAFEMREWLVKNVKGLGYKEATHFLRNVGKNEGLAILDRHILRNLKRLGIIRTIPASISKARYLQIEQRFSKFAENIGIKIDELDLTFWSMETGEIRK